MTRISSTVWSSLMMTTTFGRPTALAVVPSVRAPLAGTPGAVGSGSGEQAAADTKAITKTRRSATEIRLCMLHLASDLLLQGDYPMVPRLTRRA